MENNYKFYFTFSSSSWTDIDFVWAWTGEAVVVIVAVVRVVLDHAPDGKEQHRHTEADGEDRHHKEETNTKNKDPILIIIKKTFSLLTNNLQSFKLLIFVSIFFLI